MSNQTIAFPSGWQPPKRATDTTTAKALAVLCTLIWILGPVCWGFAAGELEAIKRGEADPRDRSSLQSLHVWGIAVSLVYIATTAYVIATTRT